MELAQDRVQWLALVLGVLNLGVLLKEHWLGRFPPPKWIHVLRSS
jgi:hypothetical protein